MISDTTLHLDVALDLLSTFVSRAEVMLEEAAQKNNIDMSVLSSPEMDIKSDFLTHQTPEVVNSYYTWLVENAPTFPPQYKPYLADLYKIVKLQQRVNELNAYFP